jgi:hypothetical protein
MNLTHNLDRAALLFWKENVANETQLAQLQFQEVIPDTVNGQELEDQETFEDEDV